MPVPFESPEVVSELLARGFTHHPVLVVGDLMLDRYLWGEVGRISPEAPVPVVRLTRQFENLGGAANVALNLRGLGLTVFLAGLVGTDPEGTRLRTLLEKSGIQDGGLLSLGTRPTTRKTRVIGEHQQMLRVDMEDTSPLPKEISTAWIQHLKTQFLHDFSAVILSDYGKGALSPEVCQSMIAAARDAGIPVLIDPKGREYDRYRGATLLSPNRSELALATGVPTKDLEALLEAGEQLRVNLNLRYLLVTLGDQGMTLLDGSTPIHLPAVAREVYDVSGAGDTVIATTAAGLAAGLPIQDTLRLANFAAGVVIGKVGTTPIALSELAETLSGEQGLAQKVFTLEKLLIQVEKWRGRGEKLVFTNGCFDLLHVGHVTYLERARQTGHRLIVGLNTDRSVSALKGPSRPVVPQKDRAQVLAALASVDAVVLFDEDTPLSLICALRPDVLVKGADYQGRGVVGATEVESWGGRVYFAPLSEGRSSTAILEKVLEQ